MKEITEQKTSGCGCSSAAQQQNTEELNFENLAAPQNQKRRFDIEFLYLDLDVCDRCKSSETNIVAALDDFADLLRTTGVEITLNRIHVKSLEQAVALGFQTSPTVRVNGKDLQLKFKESHCSKCSELSGTETNCRVWDFQGREHKSLPKEMLVEAVLREIYGGAAQEQTDKTVQNGSALENLAAFFEAKKQKEFVPEEGNTKSNLSKANQNKTWNVLGIPVQCRVSSEETNGDYSIVEVEVGSNEGAPPHIHGSEEEIFYVLKGEFEFTSGERSFTARQGKSVVIPRGTVHSFRNVGRDQGRLLATFAPGGFENFFAKIDREITELPPDNERIKQIGKKYNAEFLI